MDVPKIKDIAMVMDRCYSLIFQGIGIRMDGCTYIFFRSGGCQIFKGIGLCSGALLLKNFKNIARKILLITVIYKDKTLHV